MSAKILIVEDDVLTSANVVSLLEEKGFEARSVYSPIEALQVVKDFNPELIVMDIDLKADTDGIELAARINQDYPVPIIYLTDKQDERFVTKARNVHHAFYMNKPFTDAILLSQIELILKRPQKEAMKKTVEALFVKEHANSSQKTKVLFTDIAYLKAGRVYCDIYYRNPNSVDIRKVEVSSTLKDILKKMPSDKFLRVHRSYAVNLDFVHSVDSKDVVMVDNTSIGIGEKYKAPFLERLNMV